MSITISTLGHLLNANIQFCSVVHKSPNDEKRFKNFGILTIRISLLGHSNYQGNLVQGATFTRSSRFRFATSFTFLSIGMPANKKRHGFVQFPFCRSGFFSQPPRFTWDATFIALLPVFV